MWAKLAHKRTGELFWIDSRQARVTRLRRRVFAWAEHVAAEFPSDQYDTVMVTLTYKKITGWRKRHISEFVKWAKARWPMVAYAWVAELQKRGAIHYHFLAVLRKPYKRIKPDKQKGWLHGSTKVEKARSPFYITKYASKGTAKEAGEYKYPKGARICAVWSSRAKLHNKAAGDFRLSAYPKWVTGVDSLSVADSSVRRHIGGGVEVDGVVHPSPYAVIAMQREKPSDV